MVDSVLWVTTDRFEASTPEANFINPRCFGEDFASWLRSRLSERTIAVSEPIQEDWGWVLLASIAQSKFTISIGVMDASIGQVPAVWQIGVEYEKGLNGIGAWFRPPPLKSLEELFNEVRSVLDHEPGFIVSNEEP